MDKKGVVAAFSTRLLTLPKSALSRPRVKRSFEPVTARKAAEAHFKTLKNNSEVESIISKFSESQIKLMKKGKNEFKFRVSFYSTVLENLTYLWFGWV